ncbi:MAG: AmmeMemoRadiSam system radical SAM enzyme [Candidatus Thermoplasmatota archaeon]|jgi:pyruvate formate lyase activating enzyme|nr:AmmeMemoRadiSam system radical SAM enzyme [Candidatus Thermoplasmatota archaeon]
MKKASLYRENADGTITCTACRRYCRLHPGQTGFCGVRTFRGEDLFLDVYGLPYAINIDPIEKKPVLHAYPNSRIYSFGTSGCDFACKFCQNYDMSQRREMVGIEMGPDEIVKDALKRGCAGIAYTYNEPTIFTEFARDVGVIAHRNGLFNIYVTNGYETPESIGMISEFLDFATVDFKGNASVDFYRKFMSVPDPSFIYDTIRLFRDAGIHLEITDLVVPEVGDDLELATAMIRRVMEILGDEVPISFLRYHPDYKMTIPSTPVETLMKHYRAAKELGVKYAYIGNVPGIDQQNTYCPNCGELIIRRDNMKTISVNLTDDGKCPVCNTPIPVVTGKYHPGRQSAVPHEETP